MQKQRRAAILSVELFWHYGNRGRHRLHGRRRNMETTRTKKYHKRRRTTLRRKNGNRLPVSFSDLHFDPLIFSGHFSCPFGQRAGKRSITLARSVFESRFFCSRRGGAVCCLLSWFWLPCQSLHRFQNGVRQCFQLSALVRAHGRGEAEPLVEHRHVLKLIVDEFLHEVTGLHRP